MGKKKTGPSVSTKGAPDGTVWVFDGPANNGPVRCPNTAPDSTAHPALTGVHTSVEAFLTSCLQTYGSVPYLTYCAGEPAVWRDADDLVVLTCVPSSAGPSRAGVPRGA